MLKIEGKEYNSFLDDVDVISKTAIKELPSSWNHCTAPIINDANINRLVAFKLSLPLIFKLQGT